MSEMKIEFVQVPYWRTLRPRWVWWLFGFAGGLAIGLIWGMLIVELFLI